MHLSLLSLLAAWVLAAPAAARTPVPLAPARALDAEDLKIIFDGGRRRAPAALVPAASSDDFIIKPEGDPLPPAPRYHLNLDAVPPTGFTFFCFPVKIKAASASWIRAVAMLEQD